jgi:hypothetical protein
MLLAPKQRIEETVGEWRPGLPMSPARQNVVEVDRRGLQMESDQDRVKGRVVPEFCKRQPQVSLVRTGMDETA